MARLIHRPFIVIAALLVIAASLASVAYAVTSIVNEDGYVYACVHDRTGDVRVRQEGEPCPRGFVETRWYGAAPPPAESIYVAHQAGEVALAQVSLVVETFTAPGPGGFLVQASVELVNRGEEWQEVDCELWDNGGNLLDDPDLITLAPASEGGAARYVILHGSERVLRFNGVRLECYAGSDDVIARNGDIWAIRGSNPLNWPTPCPDC